MTRDWLVARFLDLHVEVGAGAVELEIEARRHVGIVAEPVGDEAPVGRRAGISAWTSGWSTHSTAKP